MSLSEGVTVGAEIDVGWIARVEAADRAQRPEHWSRVDKIAPLIDPSAWPGEAFDGTGPDAKPIDWDSHPEVRYRRSAAQAKAMAVLAALGITPDREFDWAAFFAAEREETPE